MKYFDFIKSPSTNVSLGTPLVLNTMPLGLFIDNINVLKFWLQPSTQFSDLIISSESIMQFCFVFFFFISKPNKNIALTCRSISPITFYCVEIGKMTIPTTNGKERKKPEAK